MRGGVPRMLFWRFGTQDRGKRRIGVLFVVGAPGESVLMAKKAGEIPRFTRDQRCLLSKP